MFKKILITFFVLFVLGVAYGLYMYFKPVPGTAGQEPSFSMTASDLFAEFENDETAANEKYLNKVILVEGVVASVSNDSDDELSIILETDSPIFGVSCSMEPGEGNSVRSISEQDKIQIKGICTGMLSDVVLNRCVIEK